MKYVIRQRRDLGNQPSKPVYLVVRVDGGIKWVNEPWAATSFHLQADAAQYIRSARVWAAWTGTGRKNPPYASKMGIVPVNKRGRVCGKAVPYRREMAGKYLRFRGAVMAGVNEAMEIVMRRYDLADDKKKRELYESAMRAMASVLNAGEVYDWIVKLKTTSQSGTVMPELPRESRD